MRREQIDHEPKPVVANVIEQLTQGECVSLLATATIGRVAVVEDDYPLVFPVNFVVILRDPGVVITFRTRPGGAIDHQHRRVCFEVDSLDDDRNAGWSVLVRGDLVEAPSWARFDPHPLVTDERWQWLMVVPNQISGRRVASGPARWPFDPHGYL